MKQSILIILIMTSVQVSHAQDVKGSKPAFGNKAELVYSHGASEFFKVILIEGKLANELFQLLTEWLIETFNSPGDVAKKQFNQREIVGEGLEPGILLTTFPRVTANLKYTFSIKTDDNAVHFTMFNMEILTALNNKYAIEEYLCSEDGREETDKQARAVKAKASQVANILINSLEVFFAGKNRKDNVAD